MIHFVEIYRRLSYEAFRQYFRLVLPFFYDLEGLKQNKIFKENMPTIVVSNHPNTLIDPTVSGVYYPEDFRFLANTGLFQHKISRWFFLIHYCIPIKRSQDPSLPGFSLDTSFELSTAALKSNSCLYIAAEGTSYQGYQIRKIKYGIEKIVKDFFDHDGSKIRIVINTINYEAPSQFRSKLFMAPPVSKILSINPREGALREWIKSELKRASIHLHWLTMKDAQLLYQILYPIRDPSARQWYENFKTWGDQFDKKKFDTRDGKKLLDIAKEYRLNSSSFKEQPWTLSRKLRLVLHIILIFLIDVITMFPRSICRFIHYKIDTDIEYSATIWVSVAPLIYLIYSILLLYIFQISILFAPILTWILGLMEVQRYRLSILWKDWKGMQRMQALPMELQHRLHVIREQLIQEN